MIGYTVLGFFAALTFRTLLCLENARRGRGERDELITGNGIPPEGSSDKNGCYESVGAAQRDKGDGYSGFKYTL